MTRAHETWGASFDGHGGFSYLSRGDRVRGIWREVANRSRPAPVVVVCGAEGAASSADVERAFSSLQEWATAAAIDLPLCGARHSDKLSAGVLDPGHPLAKALRGDLERQVAADLTAALAILCQRSTPPSARAGVVAFGVGARLVREFCQSSTVLDGQLLLETEPSDRDWARLRRALLP